MTVTEKKTETELSSEARKAEEQEFHNKIRENCIDQRWSPSLEEKIKSDPMWSNMKFYSIEEKSRKAVEDWFYINTPAKVVLDYCCGNGEDSLLIGRMGAKKVVGIDISDVSVQNCQDRAEKANLSHIVSFEAMDAEKMTFADNSFDVATEYGALHHIDLEKGFSELARVLRPSGKMICVETLGHNPIIHYYRKSTPEIRTPWEVDHILKKKDIYKAFKYFNRVDFLGFFYLSAIAAVPFRNMPGFKLLLGFLNMVDQLLFLIPFVRWHAWQTVFVLSEPKKG